MPIFKVRVVKEQSVFVEAESMDAMEKALDGEDFDSWCDHCWNTNVEVDAVKMESWGAGHTISDNKIVCKDDLK